MYKHEIITLFQDVIFLRYVTSQLKTKHNDLHCKAMMAPHASCKARFHFMVYVHICESVCVITST